MSELRKDPLTGNWVIIASERALRPNQFMRSETADHGNELNPFAVGNESLTPPEIMRIPNPEAPDTWLIRVIPNKYPALAVEGATGTLREGLYEHKDGLGAHEVIIESPDPTFNLEELPIAHLEKALWTYRERMQDLSRDIRLIFSMLFRNSGPGAGATVRHGHAQLIALPVVPSQVQQRLECARRHYEHTGANVFSQLVQQESTDTQRIVCASESFVCITPYASRTPFELMIIPKDQKARYENVEDGHLNDLARILSESLRRLKRVLGNVDYNLMIQSAPKSEEHAPWYRWHIQIVPTLTQVAGFEWGTGFHINPVSPETAAKTLKTVHLQ
ncbi:MAG: galactose-1-phosphate uridylyltransferase [Bradymonadia bacterium]